MASEKIKWHPAFAAAIQLEFKEYSEALEFSIEHQLTDEPLKIDIVMIKKVKDVEINKKIGKILRKYNVFEYKSPTDYISIDDFYKVRAYAYLYKALSKATNDIDIEDLTITLATSRYPKKLIRYLKEKHKVEVINVDSGIYYLENLDIKTQLIITKELKDEEAVYLKLLQMEHQNSRLMINWINEYIKNIKNPLYAVIMNVLAEVNLNDVMEGYKDMAKAQLSSENMEFLLEMVKKFQLDKRLNDEGGSERAIKIATKMLSRGDSVENIIDVTELSREEVLRLKNEMIVKEK